MTKLNPTLQADFLPAEPQGKPFQMDFIKNTAYKNKDEIKSSKSEVVFNWIPEQLVPTNRRIKQKKQQSGSPKGRLLSLGNETKPRGKFWGLIKVLPWVCLHWVSN